MILSIARFCAKFPDMIKIIEQFDFLSSSPDGDHTTGDWGEHDQLIDFSVEEMLDMSTVEEVQSDPTPKGKTFRN